MTPMIKLMPICMPHACTRSGKGRHAGPLDQIKQQMPPIQHGNGQQIQNAQANTQIRKEIRKLPHPGLSRSARHFSNGYRPTQVFYRELAEQHFLQRIEGQHTHGPGPPSPLGKRLKRAKADLTEHLRRPGARLAHPPPGNRLRAAPSPRERQASRTARKDLIAALHAQLHLLCRTHAHPLDQLLPVDPAPRHPAPAIDRRSAGPRRWPALQDRAQPVPARPVAARG